MNAVYTEHYRRNIELLVRESIYQLGFELCREHMMRNGRIITKEKLFFSCFFVLGQTV